MPCRGSEKLILSCTCIRKLQALTYNIYGNSATQDIKKIFPQEYLHFRLHSSLYILSHIKLCFSYREKKREKANGKTEYFNTKKTELKPSTERFSMHEFTVILKQKFR